MLSNSRLSIPHIKKSSRLLKPSEDPMTPVARSLVHSKSTVHNSSLSFSNVKSLIKQMTVPESRLKIKRILPDKNKTHRDFLTSTYKHLLLSQKLPMISVPELVQRQLTLPFNVKSEKTVFFNLEETLVYRNGNKILVRPGALHCLKATSKLFEVVVFSSANKQYTDAIVDELDPLKKYVSHRLYRENCTKFQNYFIKDLRVIVNRRIENMLIVDSSCLSFGYQLDNGVPLLPWKGNPSDREMWGLVEYLRSFKDINNIMEVNRKHFKLFAFFEDYEKKTNKNLLRIRK